MVSDFWKLGDNVLEIFVQVLRARRSGDIACFGMRHASEVDLPKPLC